MSLRSRVLQLRHSLQLAPGGANVLLPRIDVRLLPPVWAPWRLAVKGDRVLLSADARFLPEEPEETRLQVRVAEAEAALFFEDGGRWEVVLDRASPPEEPFLLPPLPARIEVELVRRSGVPRTGRTVRLASNGEVVELAEEDPGLYRSALRQWDPGFRTFRVLVNNQSVGHGAPTPFRSVTRIRFIVP